MVRRKLTAYVPRHTQKLLKNRLPTRTAADTTQSADANRMRGGALMKLRAAMFAENPLCCMCVAEGVVRQWDELDHIVALHLGGTDDKSNLQGLCIDHHRAKTAHELRELNSPKGTGGK